MAIINGTQVFLIMFLMVKRSFAQLMIHGRIEFYDFYSTSTGNKCTQSS